jgi:hypothetical protein
MLTAFVILAAIVAWQGREHRKTAERLRQLRQQIFPLERED